MGEDLSGVEFRLQPTKVHLTVATVYAMFGGFALVLALAAIPPRHHWFGGIAGLALLAFAIVRSFRIALELNDWGVVIKNHWRTREIPWTRLTRIAVHPRAMTVSPIHSLPAVAFYSSDDAFRAQATIASGRKRAALVTTLAAAAARHEVQFELTEKELVK